jgi:hypothetical protein
MQRINTAYFYRLAQKLVPLRNIAVGQRLYFDNYQILHNAEIDLRGFLTNSLVPPMTCYSTAKNLFDIVLAITQEDFVEGREISWEEPTTITEALNHFEISLQSDFGIRDTFILSPKGAYSTTLLAESGDKVVSESAHALVPSMKRDLHDGCRCLAFELPTAAAFHLFRALEALISLYGEFIRGKAFTDREKRMGLGGYSNFLKEKTLGVDQRITTTIDQIASLHRNPTMHPEMHLSNTEIMATLGMIVSAIETITLDWNRRITTPQTPLIDLLPDDSKVQDLLEDGDENGSTTALQLRSSLEGNPASIKAGRVPHS